MSSLHVNPVARRNLDADFVISFRHEIRLWHTRYGKVEPFAKFLYWTQQFFGPFDGLFTRVAGRDDQMVQSDLKLKCAAHTIRRDEENLVSGPNNAS